MERIGKPLGNERKGRGPCPLGMEENGKGGSKSGREV
jgi:hypothetical protein